MILTFCGCCLIISFCIYVLMGFVSTLRLWALSFGFNSLTGLSLDLGDWVNGRPGAFKVFSVGSIPASSARVGRESISDLQVWWFQII